MSSFSTSSISSESLIPSSSSSSSSSSSYFVQQLTDLTFDNRNLRELPVDTSKKNYSRQVKDSIYSLVSPTFFPDPVLVAYSPSSLNSIGIPSFSYEKTDNNLILNDILDYFTGNKILPGSTPASHCYAGHQFGHFSGQLGDGAAISLGEIISTYDSNRYELQLKGAGETPYSRLADGRKVLRSSLREFLCSEAMSFLKVPTTRAPVLLTSNSLKIERDPFYTGDVIYEKSSIVLRTAPHFFRIGSLEIFLDSTIDTEHDTTSRNGPSKGNNALKKQLFDFIVNNYPSFYKNFPQPDEIKQQNNQVEENDNPYSLSSLLDQKVYLNFYQELMQQIILLTCQWNTYGFVHGVLNTDNISLYGLTIDYGPYSFMEYFNQNFISNGSDSSGRYNYYGQININYYNLMKLSYAINSLLDKRITFAYLKKFYPKIYKNMFTKLNSKKLGLYFDNNYENKLNEEIKEFNSNIFNNYYSESDTIKPYEDFNKYIKEEVNKINFDNTLVNNDNNLYLINKLYDNLELSKSDFTYTFNLITKYFELSLNDFEILNSSNYDEEKTKELKEKRLNYFFTNIITICPDNEEYNSIINRDKKIIKIQIPPNNVYNFLQLYENGNIKELLAFLRLDLNKIIKDTNKNDYDELNNDEKLQVKKLLSVFHEEIYEEKLKIDMLLNHYKYYDEFKTLDANQRKEKIENIWRDWIEEYDSYLQTLFQNKNKNDAKLLLEEMKQSNPTFILRAWILDRIIKEAENENYDDVRNIIKMIENPFDEKYCIFSLPDEVSNINQLSSFEQKYLKVLPKNTSGIYCTCSS